jgi:hypothetical protein
LIAYLENSIVRRTLFHFVAAVSMFAASMVSAVQTAVVSFGTGHLKHTLVKVLGVAIALIGGSAQAAVLWNNEVNNGLGGVLVTHPGGMTGAVAGADRSAIGVGGSTFGYTAENGSSKRLADDFNAGNSWTINSIRLYTYQTNATASTITGVTLRLWSGAAGTGTLLFGDETTNVMTSTSLSNIYRTLNTDTSGTTRRIQFVDVAGLNWNIGPGSYSLDWGFTGSLSSGPFVPGLTPLGATGLTTGNGQQRVGAAGTFANALDGSTPQDFPFLIEGTEGTPAVPEPSMMVIGTLFGIGGLVAKRRRKK